jgi:prevent-host-death family protein
MIQMEYTVQQAQSQFEKLIRKAQAGQDVIIRRGKHVVRMVGIKDSSTPKVTPSAPRSTRGKKK